MSFELKKLSNYEGPEGPVVCMVLDGFGIGDEGEGDCIHAAQPKEIYKMYEEAKKEGLFCELLAHGPSVGLPDESDMGNSEVGHNALGCGQVVAQGAKLVNKELDSGNLFQSENWKEIVGKLTGDGNKTLHLVGLLSDGNIHSHIDHVVKILSAAAEAGVPKVRIHALTDGRDVGSMSALEYVEKMEDHLKKLNGYGKDYRFASGGGRMYSIMDRYEADWNIVRRGWDAMVHGVVSPSVVKECAEGWNGLYKSTKEAVEGARAMFPGKTDQDYPPWVIIDDNGEPVGKVKDDDVVVCFNFRGDRSLEISRAFDSLADTEFDTKCFNRHAEGQAPKSVDYYGMLIYDSDLMIPRKSLVPNPDIRNVMSQYLCASGVSQYAAAETHKYGHMTFFWNGNRSGKINKELETFEEIPSEPLEAIVTNPKMRNPEVAEACIKAINSGKHKYVRINLASGDMVGHTGLIPQTIETVQSLDEAVKAVVDATVAKNGIVIITADHGNCEEMKDKKGNVKTSHSLNKVPFVIIDPCCNGKYKINPALETSAELPAGLTNVAASTINLLGFEAPEFYRKSLIQFQ